ncbi:hypothetical protein [Paenibacillus oryzae]|uniref:hypothetical protein n=1 Tax=Paenibacillus oryzae TaxID=1844972 RepID=UPI0012EAA52C|nr:hypothetical protein [Paenibacillus oryzae]
MEYRLIFDVTDTYVRPIKQKLKSLPLTDISDRHCAGSTNRHCAGPTNRHCTGATNRHCTGATNRHRAAASDQLIEHAFGQLIKIGLHLHAAPFKASLAFN